MLIYLIGMMGSGKTASGKYLASQLGYKFVDTDNLIEKECHLKVHEIINQYGINYFRQKESLVLKQIQFDLNTVIATGGGIILNTDNVNIMKRTGIVIYLKTKIDELEKRLTGPEMNKRPLLKTNTLCEIYEARKDYYEQASEMTIFCDNLSIEAISNQISLKINEKKR